MDAKEIRRNIAIVLGCVLLLCAGSFTGGYFFCEQRYRPDSRRLDEYGRQMGFVRDAVGTINEGLGDLQKSIADVKAVVGSDAKDLRGYAAKLRTVAEEVRQMEDSIIGIRRSAAGINNCIDSGELDE